MTILINSKIYLDISILISNKKTYTTKNYIKTINT